MMSTTYFQIERAMEPERKEGERERKKKERENGKLTTCESR